MVINVSVQYNGGLLPDIILLTLYDSIGEPFQYHVEFLSLQPLFPRKPFDSFEGLHGESGKTTTKYDNIAINHVVFGF